MELNSKKRAYLRKVAHDMSPLVRVGKDGFSENIISSILDAIDKRELIKVKILQNSEVDKRELATELAEKSGFTDRTQQEILADFKEKAQSDRA